jgi:hypothetical protein
MLPEVRGGTRHGPNSKAIETGGITEADTRREARYKLNDKKQS